MTPLVQRFARVSPDAHTYMWFDLGDVPQDGEVNINDDLWRLPFDRTAMVGRDSQGWEFVIVCIGGDGVSVGVAGRTWDGKQWGTIEPFGYVNTPEGLRWVAPTGGKLPPRDHCLRVMAIVTYFLRGLDKARTAYRATAPDTFINRKRMAKGKPPISVTWNTVVVAPSAPAREHQGGTHASPRRHDRRGHWRLLRNGKRVWVRQAVVGDPARGLVVKDYLVRGFI